MIPKIGEKKMKSVATGEIKGLATKKKRGQPRGYASKRNTNTEEEKKIPTVLGLGGPPENRKGMAQKEPCGGWNAERRG